MARNIRLTRIKVGRGSDDNYIASATAHLNNRRKAITTRGKTGVIAAERLLPAARIAFGLEQEEPPTRDE